MYFPQVLDWFSEVTSPIAGDFLERWPTLQKVQKARPETLRRFLVQHHSCTSASIDRRLEEIRRAMPATHDAAVTCSCSAAVLALVRCKTLGRFDLSWAIGSGVDMSRWQARGAPHGIAEKHNHGMFCLTTEAAIREDIGGDLQDAER
ncbi:MAG TPA: hypothetical protein VFO40_22355 [Chthoniobacterales bacterium]|nr:hypothetical protein [Chthoniobacterales bacterium]